MGSNSEPHAISSPGYLLDRPNLSPHLRGYEESYGNEFVENSLEYPSASGLGSGSQYPMLSSSGHVDDIHQHSLGPLSQMDFGGLDDSDDQMDSPREHCISGTGSRDSGYIQPNILKQDSASTKEQHREPAQLKSGESQVRSEADNKGTNKPETRSEKTIVAGASRDDAISVDDHDSPSDEPSPRSTLSSSDLKNEASDQKDDTSLQSKSVLIDPSENMDLDDDDGKAAIRKNIQNLQKKGDLAKLLEVLEELGYQKKTAAAKSKKAASSSSTAQETSSVTCDSPGCNKSFVRRCELK